MSKNTTHYMDVQNCSGNKTGKRYFKGTAVKASIGNNSHNYAIQNDKGGKVGKRVTPSSSK